ncbi:MAG TPA: hypothetical protein VMS88_08345, partial [Terriglobales bacterium]|nr:hypothetical protein [Terriglobales bacterium]
HSPRHAGQEGPPIVSGPRSGRRRRGHAPRVRARRAWSADPRLPWRRWFPALAALTLLFLAPLLVHS